MNRHSSSNIDPRAKGIAVLVVGGVLLLTIIIMFFAGTYVTKDGTRDIVVSFGKAKTAVKPGLHVKKPIFDKIYTMDVRTRIFNGLDYNSATRQGLPLPVDVSVNWTVSEPAVIDMYVNHGTLEQFERVILSQKVEAATKAAISQFTAEELLQKRAEVETRIRDNLQTKLGEYSDLLTIGGIQVADYGFPQDYLDSINNERKAVIDARRAIAETQKQKTLDEKITNAALAEADAERARVDARAYKVTTEATAEAEAIKSVGDAEIAVLRQKAQLVTPELVAFERVQRWNGVTPTHVLGSESDLILNVGTE